MFACCLCHAIVYDVRCFASVHFVVDIGYDIAIGVCVCIVFVFDVVGLC